MQKTPYRVNNVLCFLAAVILTACASNSATLPPAPTGTTGDQATASLESFSVSTPTDTSIPPTLAVLSPEPLALFKVGVIVDTTSELVSIDQTEAVMGEANDILFRLTGYGFEMVDFTDDSSGATTDSIAQSYIANHADSLPNGLVIFSFGNNDQAKLYGGYAQQISAPGNFTNSFVSPWRGSQEVYVAVIHFSHHYAACGYAGTDSIQSAVSSNGECRGVDGVACVPFNNYQICENAVDHLYASTPTYFTATTVVHEIMHSFSPAGNADHYGTAECKTVMGWPADYFDFNAAQRYNVMCPYVYDLFVESYQP